MGIKIKKIIKKIRLKRTTVLVIVFVFLSSVLVRQLFSLQIIQGEDYISKFQTRTTKTRVIKSTRGNIYDRNGTVVASNVLAYSVTFEDSGTYNSTREKVRTKWNKLTGSHGDSTHRIYKCPTCGQKVRVPKGKGKISIHCPNCNCNFIKRT